MSLQREYSEIARQANPVCERHARPELSRPIDEDFLLINSDEPRLDVPDQKTIQKKRSRNGHMEVFMIDIPEDERKAAMADGDTNPEVMLERAAATEREEREEAAMGLSEPINDSPEAALPLALVPQVMGLNVVIPAPNLGDHIQDRADQLPPHRPLGFEVINRLKKLRRK